MCSNSDYNMLPYLLRGNPTIQFKAIPEFGVVSIKISNKRFVRNILRSSGPWVWRVRNTIHKKGWQCRERQMAAEETEQNNGYEHRLWSQPTEVQILWLQASYLMLSFLFYKIVMITILILLIALLRGFKKTIQNMLVLNTS